MLCGDDENNSIDCKNSMQKYVLSIFLFFKYLFFSFSCFFSYILMLETRMWFSNYWFHERKKSYKYKKWFLKCSNFENVYLCPTNTHNKNKIFKTDASKTRHINWSGWLKLFLHALKQVQLDTRPPKIKPKYFLTGFISSQVLLSSLPQVFTSFEKKPSPIWKKILHKY